MRDNILGILNKRTLCGCDFDSVSDELTALMCYREVRAYCYGYKGNIYNISYLIIDALGKDYPKETILQAIEQVKNEMK